MIDCEHRGYQATLARAASLGGADLIVTSPPYPDARPGDYGGDAPDDWTWADYQELGSRIFGALRPGGYCAIVVDGPIRERRPGIGSERSLIAFELAIDWSRRVGLRYVEHCAYVRDGVPGRFRDRWRSGWEPAHVFQRPGARGSFDHRRLELPAKQAGRSYRMSTTRRARGGVPAGGAVRTREGRQLTTALVFGPSNRHEIDPAHPATFRPGLARAFVLCYSEPGALVCDPFVGSGTVAIEAARAGRRFVGGDLGERPSNPERGWVRARWADLARARAEVAAPQSSPA